MRKLLATLAMLATIFAVGVTTFAQRADASPVAGVLADIGFSARLADAKKSMTVVHLPAGTCTSQYVAEHRSPFTKLASVVATTLGVKDPTTPVPVNCQPWTDNICYYFDYTLGHVVTVDQMCDISLPMGCYP